MKKSLWLFVSFLFVFVFSVPILVGADSGWDSDYGGSSWGGSSWGGSSSWSGSSSSSHWDYDSDYDGGSSSSSRSYSHYDRSSRHYSRSSSSKVDDWSFFIGFFVFSFLCIIIHRRSDKIFSSSESNYYDLDENYIGDSDLEIKQFFPNLTERELIDLLYDKFVKIQVAWMNFDYESLKKLCSNELYYSYQSDLEVLKSNHGQNIMNGFEILAGNINGIKKDGDYLIINMYLHASFYDYVIDTNDQHIEKGDNQKKLHNQYHLEFIVNVHTQNSECPSCGAAIDSDDGECPYCHTVIDRTYSDFVLNRKTKL